MNDISGQTGKFFESYANQFDEIYQLQQQTGFMGWLNRRLRASMLLRYDATFESLVPMEEHTVLDIGCGSGRYLFRSLEMGAASVTGIDLSEQMLSISCRWLREVEEYNEKASLICADFLTHDLARTFDYGIVMGLMDYIEDAQSFLDKLACVVLQKAVLSFPVAESTLAFQRKVRYRLRGCPLFLYRREQLEHLLKNSPFSKTAITRIERDYFVTVEQ